MHHFMQAVWDVKWVLVTVLAVTFVFFMIEDGATTLEEVAVDD